MSVDERMKALLVMAALFLSGGLAGGAVASLVLTLGADPPARELGPRFRPRPGGPGPGPPGFRGFAPERMLDRMTRELELTDAQRDSISGILEEQRAEADRILREMAPRLRARLDSVNAQIRRVLDETQRERFDAFLGRDRGFLGGPGPPG